MGRIDERPEYREVRQTQIAGGINSNDAETQIAADETPLATNVEFHHQSVTSANGAVKFNNQVAPGTAIRTRAPAALPPLALLDKPLSGAGNGLVGLVEVPLRGAGYLPYNAETDIGGAFTSEGSFLSGTEVFHVRRGRSFEFDVSFRIPEEKLLYETPTAATGNTVNGDAVFNPPDGFDVALDECFCIVAKGGDRTAPMSWALAVVNMGAGFGLQQRAASTITSTANVQGATTTFTTTSGTESSGGDWNLSTTIVGDLAYTSDGFFGVITVVNDGTDTITVVNWVNAAGTFGTPAANSTITVKRPTIQVSNYALVFMWYDAPQWGEFDITKMKYNLSTGQAVIAGAGSQFCTQAMRAIVIHKYVEPGRRYSAAVCLQMDSGSPGLTLAPGPTNTAWNADGFFKVWVRDEWSAVTSYTYVDSTATATGVEVIRGPTDSLSYLCRYGIRYAGRDARFLGMGQRFTPWMRCGFVPFGADLAPLRSGGFQMLDRSTQPVATVFGAATYDLTAIHVDLQAFVTISLAGFTGGVGNVGLDPKGVPNGATYQNWAGLTGFPNCNVNALRGYRLVTTADWVNQRRGGIMTLLDLASATTINIVNGATHANFATFNAANQFVMVQCFRWHQRELEIGQFRTWTLPRAYDAGDAIQASRRKLSIGSSVNLADETELDIGTLQEYYPCDDAGGGVLHEAVIGGTRNGYLVPLANAVGEGGSEGPNMTFLSGEGEAVVIDLSADPIFQREVAKMLASSSQGFGFEVSFVPTEAFYAIPQIEALPDPALLVSNGFRPRLVPDLVCWDVKAPPTSGFNATPRPLLTLTHRGIFADQLAMTFTRPMGFGVEVAKESDQENIDLVQPSALQPWYIDAAGFPHFRYDPSAPWVGKHVTVQVGIQSTGSADVYDVYIAVHPKELFLPELGDPVDAELQYWTDTAANTTSAGLGYQKAYLTAAHLTIRRKDLVRSVLTIGGRWNCKAKPGDAANLGVHELNARMLVDKVRWFISTPRGTLAPYALSPLNALPVAVPAGRNGKLEGNIALPQRLLTQADLLQPLGPGLASVNLTFESQSVLPGGQGLFYSPLVQPTLSVQGMYLLIVGDDEERPFQETASLVYADFHLISGVVGSGTSMALATFYEHPTRAGVSAAAFGVCGYTAFEDDVRDRVLLLGTGSAYDLTATTVADVILTDGLWLNIAPIPQSAFGLRIYSPLGRETSLDLLPTWVRGLTSERRIQDDGILGIHGFNERIYCGARGSLFEADDRWVEDGPTDDLTRSLRFRARESPLGLSMPLHADRMEGSATRAQFQATGSPMRPASATFSDAFVAIYDAWVWLDEIHEFQSVHTIVDPSTNPQLNANASGHKLHNVMRFARGKPQFGFGSTAFFTGTSVPEKGLFVATAQRALQPRRWYHVRWYVATRLEGTIVRVPWCKINGKAVSVTAGAVDASVPSAATGDWITANTIVSSGSSGQMIVGASRDAYRAVPAATTFNSPPVGVQTAPQRYQGYMHSLDGRLASLVITQQPIWSGTNPPDFDPMQIDYQGVGAYFMFRARFQDWGVGHKVIDDASNSGFLILSHPFVSVFHELGRSTLPFCFAENENQLFVTNGGKPVVLLPSGKAMFAGAPAPLFAPTFTLQRFPLWQLNRHNAVTLDDTSDPVDQSAVGSTPIYHYNTRGNAYWSQTLGGGVGGDATVLTWTTNTYFAFKCLFRLRDVTGRIQIMRRGSDLNNGGPFLEVVDGKLRVGWYDTNLKEEVWGESDTPIVDPGRLNYVYMRKRFPQADAIEGNWESSIFSNGQIRRLTMTAPAGTFILGENVTFPAQAAAVCWGRVSKVYGAANTQVEIILLGGTPAAGNTVTGTTSGATGVLAAAGGRRPMKDVLDFATFRLSTEAATASPFFVKPGSTNLFRCCASLTADTYGLPAGTSGTGLISTPGLQFTGLALGVVTTSYGAAGGSPATTPNLFHVSMVGSYFEWGTGAPATQIGKRYRITQVGAGGVTVTANNITVAAVEPGDSIDFSAIAAAIPGGVFTGVSLKKSPDFDLSRSPDAAQPILRIAGCPTQGDDFSTFKPFDGQVWCPGIAAPLGANAEGALIFENIVTTGNVAAGDTNDPIFTGVDGFRDEVFNITTVPGALQYRDTFQMAQWDGIHAPAAVFVVPVATPPPSSQPNALLGIARADPAAPPAGSFDPFWKYIQEPTIWAGTRRFAVAVHDKDQELVGNPSPILTVLPVGDLPSPSPNAGTASNPSGTVLFTLSRLPAARGNSELWIYESLADGSAGTLFRVAIAPNGTGTVSVLANDAEIQKGPALEFVNFEPPRCELVQRVAAYMVYAAHETDPTAIVPSRPGQAGLVDFAKITHLAGGSGDKITAITEIDSQGVAMKRRAFAPFAFDVDGNILLPGVVSGYLGAVSQQVVQVKDDVLYFLSERGVMKSERSAVTNLARPAYIGDNIQGTVHDDLDAHSLSRASAAISGFFNQYIVALRQKGQRRQAMRVAVETQHTKEGARLAWSRYFEPSISALASVQAKDGGLERVVGGTEEGFMVWLDVRSTALCMLGPDPAMWGHNSLAAFATGEAGGFSADDPTRIDSSLEGPRGAIARYLDSGGAVHAVQLLGADGAVVHFAENVAILVPAQQNVTVGGLELLWSTGWVDMGNAERVKQLIFTDLIFRQESGGEVEIAIYVDWDSMTPAVAPQTLDLSESTHQLDWDEVSGKLFKLVIRSLPSTADVAFDLSSIVWRVNDLDPT